MKRILALLLICVILIFSLVGCGKSYREATAPNETDVGKGYFTTVKYWGGGGGIDYYIVYANDTKVMYFLVSGGYTSGITPLYNADGTLQIYNEE
jgi:hypothetical protein